MFSAVIKRSVTVRGHKTSVTVEDAFWQGLRDIALFRKMTVASLLDEIDSSRHQANLSSHIRIYVLDYFAAQRTELASGAPVESAPPPC